MAFNFSNFYGKFPCHIEGKTCVSIVSARIPPFAILAAGRTDQILQDYRHSPLRLDPRNGGRVRIQICDQERLYGIPMDLKASAEQSPGVMDLISIFPKKDADSVAD